MVASPFIQSVQKLALTMFLKEICAVLTSVSQCPGEGLFSELFQGRHLREQMNGWHIINAHQHLFLPDSE